MNRNARRAAVAQARTRRSWVWEERVIPAHELARFPAVARMRTAYVNDLYSVQVFDVATAIGPVQHLIVRATDGKGEPPWRDMQRIKDELIGTEAEAVQVYPRQADITDQANCYHLWVLPPAWPLPFGLHREMGLERRP